jgi:hypothetical protein
MSNKINDKAKIPYYKPINLNQNTNRQRITIDQTANYKQQYQIYPNFKKTNKNNQKQATFNNPNTLQFKNIHSKVKNKINN